MPHLSALSVRIALLYLATGFSLGMLLLFNKGIPLGVWVWRLLPAHIEFLLLGWSLHLIFGVAFWILPRFAREPKRGNESLAWTALLLLNLGIFLVGVVPLFADLPALTLLGRIAEAGAAASFALHAWPRVKPVGA